MKKNDPFFHSRQVSNFVNDRCITGGDEKIKAVDLHDEYMKWIDDTGEVEFLRRNSFTRTLRSIINPREAYYGPQRVGNEVFRGFRGIAIKK